FSSRGFFGRGGFNRSFFHRRSSAGGFGGGGGFSLGGGFGFQAVGFALGALGGAFLGLLARLGLLRVVALGPLDLGAQGLVLRQEARDAVGRLGALGQPFSDALLLQDDARGGAVLGQHRVVAADALDEFAVARSVRVGVDDVVVGALLGAGAGQGNLQHCQSLSRKSVLLGEARQARKPPRQLSAPQAGEPVLNG